MRLSDFQKILGKKEKTLSTNNLFFGKLQLNVIMKTQQFKQTFREYLSFFRDIVMPKKRLTLYLNWKKKEKVLFFGTLSYFCCWFLA